jgi:hypothetical protein
VRGTRVVQVLAAVAVVATVLLAGAGAASAGYPGGTTLTASDTNPPCGATITLTGTNFLPNSTVTIQARAAQFQVDTDAQGNFSTPFTLPGHPCKGETVVVSASDGTNSVSIQLQNGTRPGPAFVGTPGPPPGKPGTTGPPPGVGAGKPPWAGPQIALARSAVVPVAGFGLVVLTLRKRAQARRHRRS